MSTTITLGGTVLSKPPVGDGIELSVVMPCLNEAETLEACIRKAQSIFAEHHISGEVVVADNGSTDGSQEIARRLGAVVLDISERGYGNALRAGIESSHGKYIVMGDADDSYDFSKIYPFVEKLRDGHDLVMGNRFKGGIDRGAMPWLHKWIGNPILTGLGRLFFTTPLGDFHCGLRAFTKSAYKTMDLHATGMEFASEMVVKASLLGLNVDELPFPLNKDGRSRPPHLRSWHDGWRHLRFLLLYSPRWLFLFPGIALFLGGGIVSALLLRGPIAVGSVVFDIHTMLLGGFCCVIGFQLIVFALFTKIFAIREGFHPPHSGLSRLYKFITLEVGLLVGAATFIAGAILLGIVFFNWQHQGFSQLDPRVTMRQTIPALVLMAIGTQTVFASFFLSILGMQQQRH